MPTRLMGFEGSFTFAGGTYGECVEWQGVFGGKVFETTPSSWTGVRRDYGLIDAQGTITFLVDTTADTPPIPDGATGTLVLLDKSGMSYTFTAILTGLNAGIETTQGAPVRNRYQWALSYQGSADAQYPSVITVA